MFTNKELRTLINLKILDMIMDDKESLSDRPPTPTEEDCCGNSCNPCIFDIHKKLIDQWDDNKKSNSKIKSKNLLVPTLYKTFKVIKINEINDDYLTIILHYEDDSHSCIFLNPGQHVIINLLTWSKPFTPITWNNNNIEFLVRVYPNSTFTNKLKNLQVGDQVKIRGPYGEFLYFQNSFKKIIMYCIGSGIAAFYPIIQSIVNNDLEETRIKLFAGFRSVCQIPLKQRLQLLADYWNVEFTIHVTEKK
ncbi:NADH-cytochrome b5 reductase-like isoform X2 [Chelonus insularis]|uniref:NADH-cytochrome b5 reductase-like isoform X2 n=1 Tax=Chelonus insularis TaxID=460826 RepID=UPI00158CEBFD|nr:NADH-cytochrome b5 reductase-like isoform X2 [Chelonus insularis]